ncbi:MAG: DUF3747 domain-containing protein [Vulcanococcus sp.]
MSMGRRYVQPLRWGLAAAAAAALLGEARAAGLFGSQPLDGSRFAVLARPVGRAEWNLLVLEQIQAQPRCWEPRADGLIDPALNRFDFTSICSRYLDSNGYSLRVGDEDLAGRYRLRLEQRGNSVVLLAMSPAETGLVLVGRGALPRRDRDGFVPIRLEPGWELQRRVYGQQTLNHVYFANATPLAQLLGSNGTSLASQPASPPAGQPFEAAPRATPAPLAPAVGPIAHQVITLRP